MQLHVDAAVLFRSETDHISLHISSSGRRSIKKAYSVRLKLVRNEIWQDCSSSKYASIDLSRICEMASYFQHGGHDSIWSSVRRLPASPPGACLQFQIHSTFVLVSGPDTRKLSQNTHIIVIYYAVSRKWSQAKAAVYAYVMSLTT